MPGFNPYAAAGVPTPQVTNPLAASKYASLYRKGATSGTLKGDPLANFLGGLFGRPASAEQMGPQIPPGLKAPPAPTLFSPQAAATLGATPVPAGRGPTPIIQAADEEYNRLKSQYGGPAGVEQLAMQTSLPTGFIPTGAKGPASLKDFYSAERQVGGRDLESIIPSLTKGLDPTQTKNITEWATANPMLAQREYAKRMGAQQEAAGYGGYGAGQPVADPALMNVTGSFFPGDQSAPIGSSPLNPIQGYSVPNSAVSPQAAYSSKFGLNGNFGTPGTVENAFIAGAANSVPSPPSDNSDFNWRMDAINRQKAQTNLQNTLPAFSDYWNPAQ